MEQPFKRVRDGGAPVQADLLALVDEHGAMLEYVNIAELEIWQGTIPSAETRLKLIAVMDELLVALHRNRHA